MLLKFFLGAILIGVVGGLAIGVIKGIIYVFFAAIFKGIPYLLGEMFGGEPSEPTKEVTEIKLDEEVTKTEVEAPKKPIDPLLSLEPDKEKFVSKWKKNNEGKTFKNFEKWSEA